MKNALPVLIVLTLAVAASEARFGDWFRANRAARQARWQPATRTTTVCDANGNCRTVTRQRFLPRPRTYTAPQASASFGSQGGTAPASFGSMGGTAYTTAVRVVADTPAAEAPAKVSGRCDCPDCDCPCKDSWTLDDADLAYRRFGDTVRALAYRARPMEAIASL